MKELNPYRVPEFVLAGNATVTVKSAVTQRRFTYKILQSEKPELYFVHLLRGPDNEEDYSYVGCYYRDSRYFHPCKRYRDVPRRSRSVAMQAIEYFLEHLYDIPHDLLVYHEGKCARCGRKLTTPESIERGFGPECLKEVAI